MAKLLIWGLGLRQGRERNLLHGPFPYSQNNQQTCMHMHANLSDRNSNCMLEGHAVSNANAWSQQGLAGDWRQLQIVLHPPHPQHPRYCLLCPATCQNIHKHLKKMQTIKDCIATHNRNVLKDTSSCHRHCGLCFADFRSNSVHFKFCILSSIHLALFHLSPFSSPLPGRLHHSTQ